MQRIRLSAARHQRSRRGGAQAVPKCIEGIQQTPQPDIRNTEIEDSADLYVARHSWATTALQKGVPVSVISAGMGHASEKVTYIYLASFDNKTLSNANKKVIAAVRFKKEEEE